ncbi:SGNH hydrolase domain-containing protein [Aeromicrobium sp. UC242_57]|uniref:SGNH hydrolase domain-containing protein n=1 Tax=Aeromicrobium sp. UC242_57 TaxID=3374624 RepID=UPI0037BA417D
MLGDPDGDVDVAVVGDSKTRQWAPALDIAAKELGWRLVVSTKSTCAFTTAEVAHGGAYKSYPSCDQWNADLIAKLERDKPDIVINALYKMKARNIGTGVEPRDLMIDGVRDALGRVAAHGAQVIVFDSTPMNGMDIPQCVMKHASKLTECSTPREKAYGSDVTWDDASIERALSEVQDAHRINVNDYICPGSACAPVIGNILVFRDRHHVTVPYMKTLAPMVLAQLKALDLN